MQKIKIVFNGSFYDEIVWLEPLEKSLDKNGNGIFIYNCEKKSSILNTNKSYGRAITFCPQSPHLTCTHHTTHTWHKAVDTHFNGIQFKKSKAFIVSQRVHMNYPEYSYLRGTLAFFSIPTSMLLFMYSLDALTQIFNGLVPSCDYNGYQFFFCCCCETVYMNGKPHAIIRVKKKSRSRLNPIDVKSNKQIMVALYAPGNNSEHVLFPQQNIKKRESMDHVCYIMLMCENILI